MQLLAKCCFPPHGCRAVKISGVHCELGDCFARDGFPKESSRDKIMRSTHTYVVLDVPEEFFKFVWDKLKAAGYDQALHKDGSVAVIDMHGIALGVEKKHA